MSATTALRPAYLSDHNCCSWRRSTTIPTILSFLCLFSHPPVCFFPLTFSFIWCPSRCCAAPSTRYLIQQWWEDNHEGTWDFQCRKQELRTTNSQSSYGVCSIVPPCFRKCVQVKPHTSFTTDVRMTHGANSMHWSGRKGVLLPFLSATAKLLRKPRWKIPAVSTCLQSAQYPQVFSLRTRF